MSIRIPVTIKTPEHSEPNWKGGADVVLETSAPFVVELGAEAILGIAALLPAGGGAHLTAAQLAAQYSIAELLAALKLA